MALTLTNKNGSNVLNVRDSGIKESGNVIAMNTTDEILAMKLKTSDAENVRPKPSFAYLMPGES